jgi:hypothetical protein
VLLVLPVITAEWTHTTLGFYLEAGGGEWAELKMLWLLFCSLSGLRGDGETQRRLNMSEIAVRVAGHYMGQ